MRMEVSIENVTKKFGMVEVLSNVDFSVKSGEITALLGENGAGKSTLMNILGGIYHPTKGTIHIDGKEVYFHTPSDSLKAGIAFIHQELNLVNHLTIYENLFLSKLAKKNGFLDSKKMIEETQALFDILGIELSPMTMVGELDAAYKQIVEICRAMMSKASIIIMDEPTSSLGTEEIKRVLDMMRSLKKKGVGIIFISHKLDEVMEICDTFTVLRNGKVAKRGNIADVSAKIITESMCGHEIIEVKKAQKTFSGKERLHIENLSDGQNFFDINMKLYPGEILGVTGLIGNGADALFHSIIGMGARKTTGNIFLDGEKVTFKNPNMAFKKGFAFLPDNRKENSIIPDMSIIDNGTIVTLKKMRRGPFIDDRKRKEELEKWKNSFSIQHDNVYDPIVMLSGGNQQKVMLSKLIMSEPRIMILNSPTQGVDVGAKEDMYKIIEELSMQGHSTIVISSEAKEIIKLCDRAYVMYKGRITGELKQEDMSESKIKYLATGAERK